jgi:citrate lyase subunit beta / citryl-CoA lyase
LVKASLGVRRGPVSGMSSGASSCRGSAFQARQYLIAHPLDSEQTIVRINPAGTEDFTPDLLALQQTEYRYVRLAKTGEPQSLVPLADYSVIALC